MNQWDYDTITNALRVGTPVFAEHLIKSLQDLITEHKKLQERLMELENTQRAEDAEMNDRIEKNVQAAMANKDN